MNENEDIYINDLINTNEMENFFNPIVNVNSTYQSPQPGIINTATGTSGAISGVQISGLLEPFISQLNSVDVRQEIERRFSDQMAQEFDQQVMDVMRVEYYQNDTLHVDIENQTITSRHGNKIKSGIIKSTDGKEYIVELVIRKKSDGAEPTQRQITI